MVEVPDEGIAADRGVDRGQSRRGGVVATVQEKVFVRGVTTKRDARIGRDPVTQTAAVTATGIATERGSAIGESVMATGRVMATGIVTATATAVDLSPVVPIRDPAARMATAPSGAMLGQAVASTATPAAAAIGVVRPDRRWGPLIDAVHRTNGARLARGSVRIPPDPLKHRRPHHRQMI